MSFLAPIRLLLLLPVAALVVTYLVMQRRRRKYAVRFTSMDLLDKVAPNRSGWRRHVAAGLLGLAAVAMVVGLARPTVETTVEAEGGVVVLAIDTSLSMDATDVAPNRLDAAIAEANEFVEGLPDAIEVGLVSFDGTATVLAMPTTDHVDVIDAISDLGTGPGTAGGDAIYAALTAIESAESDVASAVMRPDTPADETDGSGESQEAPTATIVLLSDGETTQGSDVLEAADRAASSTVPISTITYGTDSGSVVVDGEVVPVPPDADTMQEIADRTGGLSFEAASADELAAVYADLEGNLASETEQREISLLFVAIGFAVLVMAAAASMVWTGRFP
jgi:Ca-activated chloride channel family protein